MSRCASGPKQRLVSCWPCRSTSSAPISASTPIVVGDRSPRLPFPQHFALQASPSSSNSIPTRRRATADDGCTADANSNAPSTIVFLGSGAHDVRRRAFAEQEGERVDQLDFPAPVSPVRTLRPGWNGRVTSAMTARSRTRNSVNDGPTHCPRCVGVGAQHATPLRNSLLPSSILRFPVQLLPQPLEEALGARRIRTMGRSAAVPPGARPPESCATWPSKETRTSSLQGGIAGS